MRCFTERSSGYDNVNFSSRPHNHAPDSQTPDSQTPDNYAPDNHAPDNHAPAALAHGRLSGCVSRELASLRSRAGAT
jgi:hypothetical protein